VGVANRVFPAAVKSRVRIISTACLLTFGVARNHSGVLTNIYGCLACVIPCLDVFKGVDENLASCSCLLPSLGDRDCADWCALVPWFMIEKTKLGAYLRAGTEDSQLMQGFGINVPLLVSLTYGFGVHAGGFCRRILAAPIISVTPDYGFAHFELWCLRGGHWRHGVYCCWCDHHWEF